MANRRYSSQFRFSFHHFPVSLDANFIVDPNNGNGLGQRSLKTEGITNVFMHTTPAATTATSVFASGASTIYVSSTVNLVPGEVVTDTTTGGNITGGTTIVSVNTVNSTITLSAPTAGASAASPGDTLSFAMTAALAGNPNPASGYIYVQFSDSYNSYIDGFSGYVAPLSGTPLTSGLTTGIPYVIVSLGATTTAQWQTAGVPTNVTPAVGLSFIAAATSVAGGGSVEAALTSGIDHIEVVGDPRTTLTSNTPGQGGYMILKCLSAGSVTAPTTGSTVGLDFQMSNSNLY